MDSKEQDKRQAIISIQRDSSLTPDQKTRAIQALFNCHRQDDAAPVNRHVTPFLVLAPCCDHWICCESCHGDHTLDKIHISLMMCQHCKTEQPLGYTCANCGLLLASYHCTICNHLDYRNVFHCELCGVCRLGRKDDYSHCDTCNICVTKNATHCCFEFNSGECPCCNESIPQSRTEVISLPCGHVIHKACRQEMVRACMYKCPLCAKSILKNMTNIWDQVEFSRNIQTMPYPENTWTVDISCIDCDGHKTFSIPYHFVGHMCDICKGWNTRVEKIHKPDA
jgi:RING finger and CHY zinc finger domain-containing protein 1